MSEASKTPVVSPFIYLLNSFELASQSDVPAAIGYESKRRAVIDYVLQVERERTEAIDRAQRAERWLAVEREKEPEVYSLRGQNADLRHTITEQSSKLAELEKDAARLDWWGGDIRNAIDKAMAEGKPARKAIASSGQGEGK